MLHMQSIVVQVCNQLAIGAFLLAEILNSELARVGHDVSVSKWWVQRLLRSLDYSHKTNTGLSGTQVPAVIRCHSEASIPTLRQKRDRPRIQKSGKKGSHTLSSTTIKLHLHLHLHFAAP